MVEVVALFSIVSLSSRTLIYLKYLYPSPILDTKNFIENFLGSNLAGCKSIALLGTAIFFSQKIFNERSIDKNYIGTE